MSETTYEQHQRTISRTKNGLKELHDAVLAYVTSATENDISADIALKVIDLMNDFGEDVDGLLVQARQHCQDIVAGKLSVSN